MEFNSYLITKDVVDEATERFSPLWKLDLERWDILQDTCEFIDRMLSEADAEEITVEVNEETKQIVYNIVSPYLVAKDRSAATFSLLECAVTTRFYKQEDSGYFVIEMVFPSVWKKRRNK